MRYMDCPMFMGCHKVAKTRETYMYLLKARQHNPSLIVWYDTWTKTLFFASPLDVLVSRAIGDLSEMGQVVKSCHFPKEMIQAYELKEDGKGA